MNVIAAIFGISCLASIGMSLTLLAFDTPESGKWATILAVGSFWMALVSGACTIMGIAMKHQG